MITNVSSIAFSGINLVDVDVQVQINPGIPKFTIVGLADKIIAESKERVGSALSAIGISLPAKKILINLAPADLIKEGSHFDLPIIIAILTAMKILDEQDMSKYLILGELALNGTILPVNGVLPAALGASSRNKGIICSKQNAQEAAWSGNSDIIAPDHLLELINHFKGEQVLSQPEISKKKIIHNYPDISDIKGQKFAKRAIEIAASGGHNLLMFGPPGSGKSILAERLIGLIPDIPPEEMIECTSIASIAGKIQDGTLITARPFRAPHHSCTVAAMVGGGTGRKIKPGEISLAHNGILFLDELPEYNGAVIDALRQPMETKEVIISRSGLNIKYPANFQLIAAMNPCKCGYLADPERACSRAPGCARNYKAKVSGPILDRFDLHVEVGYTQGGYDYESLLDKNSQEETTKNVRTRVEKAREIQSARYQGYNILLNNDLNGQLIIDFAIPVEEGKKMLNEAAKKFRLSIRAYNKILRVARTIADLANSEAIRKEHIAEALFYRAMDFNQSS